MLRAGALAWGLAACTRPPEATDTTPQHTTPSPATLPSFVAAPAIAPNPSTLVRPAARLFATTDRPTRATLVLDDGDGRRELAFDALSAAHDLPLLALRPETAYVVEATFTDEDGLAVAATLDLSTDPAFGPLPDLTVLVADEARMEPGYTVFPAEIDGAAVVVAADARGRVVWTFSDGESPAARAVSFADGTFSTLLTVGVLRFTADGQALAKWVEGVPAAGGIALPVGLNHEVLFEADGSFWSLSKTARAVAEYPVSELDPYSTAPALVADDHVVHVAADGTLLSDWSLADRLDEDRIGFGSLDRVAGEYDWGHANGLALVPGEAAVLVSLRHQDAVVKLSEPDGEVQWILGNPDGWDPALGPSLLTGIGADFSWPYHQHGPAIAADGHLWLFDNGNGWRTTPYAVDPCMLGLYSRVSEYTIDEAQGTVELVSTHPGAPSGLYSQALGNADPQPVTGNVLATFSFLHEEDGIDNEDAGYGDTTSRLIEFLPATGEVVFDLRLTTEGATAPDGLLCDRAIRVPTLYGAGVTERWLVP